MNHDEPTITNEERRLHPNALLLPGLIFGVVMIALGIVWVGVLREHNIVDEWYPRVNVALEIALGVAAGLLGIALVWILTENVPAMQRLREKLTHLLKFEDLQIWHALAFGVMAGVPEEILFRGAIQPVTGLILAAIIFGVLHAITVTYMIYAVAAGFVLGFIAGWRGDLWAATAAHFTYDAGLFMLMAWRARGGEFSNSWRLWLARFGIGMTILFIAINLFAPRTFLSLYDFTTYDLQWSPDSTHAAIQISSGERPISWNLRPRENRLETFLVNARTGDLKRGFLTDRSFGQMVWSPNSDLIAVPLGDSREGDRDIYLYDVPQHKMRRMTDNMMSETSFNWSPDGKMIAFLAAPSEADTDFYVPPYRAFILNVESGRTEQISSYDSTNTSVIERYLEWSPSGTHLSFSSVQEIENEETDSIRVFDTKQNVSWEVARATSGSAYFSGWGLLQLWSPNGRHLAIASDSTIFISSIDNRETITFSLEDQQSNLSTIQWSEHSELLTFAVSYPESPMTQPIGGLGINQFLSFANLSAPQYQVDVASGVLQEITPLPYHPIAEFEDEPRIEYDTVYSPDDQLMVNLAYGYDEYLNSIGVFCKWGRCEFYALAFLSASDSETHFTLSNLDFEGIGFLQHPLNVLIALSLDPFLAILLGSMLAMPWLFDIECWECEEEEEKATAAANIS